MRLAGTRPHTKEATETGVTDDALPGTGYVIAVVGENSIDPGFELAESAR